MERLKSGLLLIIIGLTAVPTFGQQAAQSPTPAGFVAVVGDVERCRNYPVPADSALTVRQAVQNAGLVSDMVNVKVIRATQDSTQFTLTYVISDNSADNGEPVENGDVLLVQSMSPMKAEVRKNAALRTDSGVIVVGLEEEGIKIGDVLLYAQTTPPAEEQLKVICRFQGQPPISKAELYSLVRHGDVISVSHDNRRVLKGFGNMAPAVSEWKNQSASLPKTSTPANSSDTSDDFSLSNVPSDSQSFEFPASPVGSLFLPIPGDDVLESSGFSADAGGEVSVSTSALSVSQSEDIADMASTTTAEGKISFASESAAVAPIAPPEIKLGAVASSKSSTFNPWNLVFVGGLLLAGTLILAGTLRLDPDDNSKFIETAARESVANSKRLSTVLPAPPSPVTSPLWQITPKANLPPADVVKSSGVSADAEFKTKAEIQTATPEPVANSLVASHEWFGGDWNGRVASSNDLQNYNSPEADCLTETSEDQTAESNTSLENETDLNSVVAAVTSQEEATIPDVPALEVDSAEIETTAESTNIVTVEEIVAAVSNADTNENEGNAETSTLEDLLQNRLPIDLCEAQLPLRIALFGKPAGPRRLRIDAAHKTVPPPHVNLTADKRREQQVTVTAAAAPKQSTADSSGGLDHALHYLQERVRAAMNGQRLVIMAAGGAVKVNGFSDLLTEQLIQHDIADQILAVKTAPDAETAVLRGALIYGELESSEFSSEAAA
jgi:hypothetical protein